MLQHSALPSTHAAVGRLCRTQHSGMRMQCTGICWHRKEVSSEMQRADFRTQHTLLGMHWLLESWSLRLRQYQPAQTQPRRSYRYRTRRSAHDCMLPYENKHSTGAQDYPVRSTCALQCKGASAANAARHIAY